MFLKPEFKKKKWRALWDGEKKIPPKTNIIKLKIHLVIFFYLFFLQKKFLVIQGVSARDSVSQWAKHSTELVPK